MYGGVRIIENALLEKGGLQEKWRTLSMVDQWRKWGWKLWRYRERAFILCHVEPMIIQQGTTVYCHPLVARMVRQELARKLFAT